MMKKLSPCVLSVSFFLSLSLPLSLSASLPLLSIEVNHQLYVLENDSLFFIHCRRLSSDLTSSSPMQPLTPNDDAQRLIRRRVIV